MSNLSAAPRKTSEHTWLLLALYGVAIALFTIYYIFRLGRDAGWFHLGGMLIGALSGASCAALGCFLVLRRMSLLGDAISHAALPGIAVAYLLSHQLGGWPMLAGAFVLGVMMAALAEALHGVGKLPEDVSIGVVYTALFALGVILITAQSSVHLDPQCALFGALELTTLDVVRVGPIEFPRAAILLSVVLFLTALYLLLFWKELKLVAFDPALARAIGLPVVLIHLSLMGLVAGSAVASFEAVGSILVVAMLVVPAATAQLLCNRLAEMLAWAVALSIGAAILGYAAALEWSTNAAGMMSVVAGIQLAIAVLAAPQHGLVSRALRNLNLALRIAREDVLGKLYRLEEVTTAMPDMHPSVASWRQRAVTGLARWQLLGRGLIQRTPNGTWQLSSAGQDEAKNLVRAHRLWETYLETHFELPVDHLHDAAERMEHFLNAELQAELDSELAGRTTDPHGKAIPATSPRQ